MPTLSKTFDDIQSRVINATSRVVPMHRQIQGLKLLMGAKKKAFGPRRPVPEFVESAIPDVNTLALEDIDVSNPFLYGRISGAPISNGCVMRLRSITRRTAPSAPSGR